MKNSLQGKEECVFFYIISIHQEREGRVGGTLCRSLLRLNIGYPIEKGSIRKREKIL